MKKEQFTKRIKIRMLPEWKRTQPYEDLLKCNHILVAGASGSGKSVFINSFIANGLTHHPGEFQIMCIDLKKVELYDYKDLPHCIGYVDTIEDVSWNLDFVLRMIDSIYTEMRSQGLKRAKGSDLWIIIDEYADLMVQGNKGINAQIQRISQIGRAAGIHLLVGTQRPTSEVLKGTVNVNLETRVGLRTSTAQDSRNIIGLKGCELLSTYGNAYLKNNGYIAKIDVPLLDATPYINWWRTN